MALPVYLRNSCVSLNQVFTLVLSAQVVRDGELLEG